MNLLEKLTDMGEMVDNVSKIKGENHAHFVATLHSFESIGATLLATTELGEKSKDIIIAFFNEVMAQNVRCFVEATLKQSHTFNIASPEEKENKRVALIKSLQVDVAMLSKKMDEISLKD
jgi:hypothetical protein